MVPSLERFSITPEGEQYRLFLETSEGERIELSVSFDQLDLLGEEIDRRLDADEEPMLPSTLRP